MNETELIPPDPTRDAYDALASAYDVLTATDAYERWLIALEGLAISHGLSGKRLLDVACGTGSSFLPMIDRGYEITGCDLSAEMLDRARRKAPTVDLQLADMRDLGHLGTFDLLTCLDDALNYALSEAELEAIFRGFRRNLAEDGIAVWDLNTTAQYRGQFAADRVIAESDLFIGWVPERRSKSGEGTEFVQVGIDVFSRVEGDLWTRVTSNHRQRHWCAAEIKQVAARSGLRILDVRGQLPGAVIEESLDELVHTKAVYVAAVNPKEQA